jgi:hypothetical protein
MNTDMNINMSIPRVLSFVIPSGVEGSLTISLIV